MAGRPGGQPNGVVPPDAGAPSQSTSVPPPRPPKAAAGGGGSCPAGSAAAAAQASGISPRLLISNAEWEPTRPFDAWNAERWPHPTNGGGGSARAEPSHGDLASLPPPPPAHACRASYGGGAAGGGDVAWGGAVLAYAARARGPLSLDGRAAAAHVVHPLKGDRIVVAVTARSLAQWPTEDDREKLLVGRPLGRCEAACACARRSPCALTIALVGAALTAVEIAATAYPDQVAAFVDSSLVRASGAIGMLRHATGGEGGAPSAPGDADSAAGGGGISNPLDSSPTPVSAAVQWP
eukprot:6315241-Prymnesium_polylepis.1